MTMDSDLSVGSYQPTSRSQINEFVNVFFQRRDFGDGPELDVFNGGVIKVTGAVRWYVLGEVDDKADFRIGGQESWRAVDWICLSHDLHRSEERNTNRTCRDICRLRPLWKRTMRIH